MASRSTVIVYGHLDSCIVTVPGTEPSEGTQVNMRTYKVGRESKHALTLLLLTKLRYCSVMLVCSRVFRGAGD